MLVAFGVALCLGTFMVSAFAACYKDEKEHILPNGLIALMFGAALAFQVIRLYDPFVFRALAHPLTCIATSFLFMVVFFILELLWRKTKAASGFGAGDIKFIGAWVLLMGPVPALCGGCFGALMGALFAKYKKQNAFAAGPPIMLASVIVFVVVSVFPLW